MHCIEVKAGNFKLFKLMAEKRGASVSVVSRYSERGVRLLDVEVSKDTAAIFKLEQRFSFNG
jgi:hypothetical protein